MAMMAAETGHLVLGTLHTTSAAKTLDRIIDVLPPEQKAQGLAFLAQSLRGVISQTLVMKPDRSGRKVIVGSYGHDARDREPASSGEAFQIPAPMQTGREYGMRLIDQALVEAVQAKEIDPDDAYLHAQDKKLLQRFVTDRRLASAGRSGRALAEPRILLEPHRHVSRTARQAGWIGSASGLRQRAAHAYVWRIGRDQVSRSRPHETIALVTEIMPAADPRTLSRAHVRRFRICNRWRRALSRKRLSPY